MATGHYCYLPLYIFCGEFLLCARLRSSNIDASAGSVEELKRIVEQIRCVWPEVRIVVRGDSGFCREELMAWCEANRVDYLLGLAKNERLKAEIEQERKEAKAQYQQTGRAAGCSKSSSIRRGELELCAAGGGQGRTPGKERTRGCGDSLGGEEWPAQGCVKNSIAPAETWKIELKNN